MKTKRILIWTLSTLLLVSLKPATGPHNGIVKPAGEYNIEMKNTYDYFFAYLLDKNQEPIPNKGMQCEVKFIHPDTTSTTIPLKPFEEDGFSSAIHSIKFSSCRVYFRVKGKLISAQFDNQNLIVQKKENE